MVLVVVLIVVALAYLLVHLIAGTVLAGLIAGKVAEKVLGRLPGERLSPRAILWIWFTPIAISLAFIALLYAVERQDASEAEFARISAYCFGTRRGMEQMCEAARAYPSHPYVVRNGFAECCELPDDFEPCPVGANRWTGTFCPWSRPAEPDPGRFVLLSADLAESMNQILELEQSEAERPHFLFSPEIPHRVLHEQEKLIAASRWAEPGNTDPR
jgi:hypothetical protein